MTPQRFLIVRTSAIGDVVFASALPAALRRTHPDAHIAWMVEPGIHELLLADPDIDEVIVWPKTQWKKLWQTGQFKELLRQFMTFRSELRARNFDVALDLQGLLKSGLLTWLSGARRRVGLGSKEGSQWLMTEKLPRAGDKRRLGSEYRFLAEQLGLEVRDFLPSLHVSQQTQERAGSMLSKHGLSKGHYAVLAPFTTRPQKHWFEDSWRTLISRLQESTGLVPVILGGPADVEAAQRIAAGYPDIVNLAGQTRLPEAAAVISQAGLLIGVDTGLTHMGAAFDTPTVALFGSTCPYLETGRANSHVIWLGLECSPCRRHPTCGGAFQCLREITAERVVETAKQLLSTNAIKT